MHLAVTKISFLIRILSQLLYHMLSISSFDRSFFPGIWLIVISGFKVTFFGVDAGVVVISVFFGSLEFVRIISSKAGSSGERHAGRMMLFKAKSKRDQDRILRII
jgi:hypothetical protein